MIGYAVINDGTGDIPVVATEVEVKKKVNRKTEYGLTGTRNPALSMALEREYEGTIKIISVAKPPDGNNTDYILRIFALALGQFSDDGQGNAQASETHEPTLPSFTLKYGIKELNKEYTATGCVVKSFKIGYKKGSPSEITISFVATGKSEGAYNAPATPEGGWAKITAPLAKATLGSYAVDILELDIAVDNDVEVLYPLRADAEPQAIRVNHRKKSGKISFRTTDHSMLDELIINDDGVSLEIENHGFDSMDGKGLDIKINQLVFGEYSDKLNTGDAVIVFDLSWEAVGSMVVKCNYP